MDFRFTCLVRTLLDGRVLLVPLDQPELSVIGESEETAREELLLGLEDRINRTHPAQLPGLVRFREATHHSIVYTREAHRASELTPLSTAVGEAQLPLTVLRSAAHGRHDEAQLVDADLRFWLSRDDQTEDLLPILRDVLANNPPSSILRLDHHGEERVEVLTIEAEPLHPGSMTELELSTPHRLIDPDRPGGVVHSKTSVSKPPKTVDTKELNSAAIPLHELAEDGELPQAFHREKKVEELLATLYPDAQKRTPEFREGHKAPAVVIVGQSGVGKTALVQEVVRRLVDVDRAAGRLELVLKDEEAPNRQRTRFDVARQRRHRAYTIDASRIIAGQSGFGDWEERTQQLIGEAQTSGALLHLGHVVELLDSGKSAHSKRNVAQLLGPALLRGEVHAVGEATPESWARLKARSESFARAFRVISLDDMSEPSVERVLLAIQKDDKRPLLPPTSVSLLVALTKRFRPYSALVGQAVAFHERLLLELRRDESAKEGGQSSWIVQRFALESGIPERLLRDDLALAPSEVNDFLTQRVMAQPAAVSRAAAAVSVMKAGLSNPDRPISVLFFAGPTGVGKTQLARALAELVFGSERRLLRIDMGELSGPDALARLMGGPQGAGLLTRSVRQQPFQIILLDELEKAHDAVFDALLGVLGEGRLTDVDGKVADFRSSIIVMTSNLGADTLKERVGFGSSERPQNEVRRHYVAEVERFFRPELFNRIDEIVVFDHLRDDAIARLVDRELSSVSARDGLQLAGIALQVDESARSRLAAEGTQPRYGARPLKRIIEKKVVGTLARELIEFKGAQRGLVAQCTSDERGEVSINLEQQNEASAHESRSLGAAAEKSQSLRQALQRVAASGAVRKLNKQFRDFAVSSKHRAFWQDRERAERLSERNGTTEAALTALSSLSEESEALEEFALDAHFTRDAEAASQVLTELPQLHSQYSIVQRKLYSALKGAQTGATIYLVGDGSSALTQWLRGVYLSLANALSLDVDLFIARADPSTNRIVDAEDPTQVRKKKKKLISWSWSKHPLDRVAELKDAHEAEALVLRGETPLAVLDLEHGRHTWSDGSTSHELGVYVEPAATTKNKLSDFQALRSALPPVRKVHLPRERVEDLRIKQSFPFHRHRFELKAVHDALLTDVLTGSKGEDPWS